MDDAIDSALRRLGYTPLILNMRRSGGDKTSFDVLNVAQGVRDSLIHLAPANPTLNLEVSLFPMLYRPHDNRILEFGSIHVSDTPSMYIELESGNSYLVHSYHPCLLPFDFEWKEVSVSEYQPLLDRIIDRGLD